MAEAASITIVKDGPYIVKGAVPLGEDALVAAPEGDHMQYNRVRDYEVGGEYHLCRCGASAHKPFCDGAHEAAGFDGAETASRAPFDERADVYEGDALRLLDDNRCAFARLCHRREGDVWQLTEKGGSELAQEAVAASWHCPTGRLEHHDRATGEVCEQTFEPSLVILQDTQKHASGPIFVRGGIPLVGADGHEYERRNRYALCRCGSSTDKPFCDAKHVIWEFNDGSPALEGQRGERDESFKELPAL